jgi:hypothetical protein
MLPTSDQSDLDVPLPPPTGRNVNAGLTFRPVGGGLEGWPGAHGATVAAVGAWVVRGSRRMPHVSRLERERPGFAGPL